MAELPSKGKQPAKRLKPSRLRNEIRPESTDDERGSVKHIIQEPDSETHIPATQLGQNDGMDHQTDYAEEVLLSPNSAAVLERNAIKKTVGPSAPAPCAIPFLTKESLGLGSNSALSPSLFFAFGQARKASSRTLPTEGAATRHNADQTKAAEIVVEHPEGQARDAGNNIAAPAARSSQVAVDAFQADRGNKGNSQPTYKIPLPGHVAFVSHDSPLTRYTDSELPQGGSNTPPSAQPSTRPDKGTKSPRAVKKRKSRKRKFPSQSHEGPWPPRPNTAAGYRNQASTDANCATAMPFISHESSRVEDQDFREHGLVVEGPGTTSAVRECHHREYVQSHDAYSLHAIDNDDSHKVMDISKTSDHVAQTNTPNLGAGSSQWFSSALTEHASAISSAQSAAVVSHRPSEFFPEQNAAITSRTSNHSWPERQSVIPTGNLGSEPRPRTANTTEAVSRPADQCLQPVTDVDVVRQPSPRPTEIEAVLHQTTRRGGPHRVSKPREKAQNTNRPLPHLVQTTAMSSGIECSLDSLRVALLADQFRTQHENATNVKHHEETIGMLRDLVSLQKDTIAEWKGRHQDLSSVVVRMTENAKISQEHVVDLQKDYEKLQASAVSFHNQSKTTLQEKIAEIECEKQSLRHDFKITIDVLAKNQKNLRATIDDLYKRLVISESENSGFAMRSSKQTAMYGEERRRRDDLEKQLLLSVQNTQRQLSDTSTALVGKFENLQSSLNEVALDKSRGTGIEECLKVLQNMQTIRVLTVEDLQKAEGMLRFLHERIDAGLGAISDVVESKHSRIEEIQTLVRDQMQNFRTEMLKYEDVVAENRKAHESNVILQTQLEAQQCRSRGLDEQLKALRKSEADLKLRFTQLEHELCDLRDLAHDHEPQSIELEQKMNDLHQQLRQAYSELVVANSKVEQTERLRLELEQDAAKYKDGYELARDKLRQVEASTKQQIVENCQKSMRESESNFKNEIHRLTIERDEKNDELMAQQKEISAAKEQLQTLRRDTKTLESELDKTRKEKTGLEAELESAQRMSRKSPSSMAEDATLKEQLRQKTEELQSITRDHAALERACVDLNHSMTDLQGSNDKLRIQVSQHVSTIDTLRQNIDERGFEARQNAQTALRSAQDEGLTLKKDKQGLVSLPEQAQPKETETDGIQHTCSIERDSLQQQQLARLQVAKDLDEAESRRVQAEAAEEKRKCEDTHRADVDRLNRRLMEGDAALKEAEARLRRLEAEYHGKIESDRKGMEDKIRLLHEKYDRKLQDVQAHTCTYQQQTTRSLNLDEPSTHSMQIIKAGSNRKKVTRHNHSVLNVTGPSDMQHDTSRHSANTIEPEVPHTQPGDSEFSLRLLAEEAHHQPAFEDFVDDHGLSLVDPADEAIDETQELGLLRIEEFGKQTSQWPQHETRSSSSNFTELSTMSSGEITQMQIDVLCPPRPSLRGRNHSFSTHNSPHGNREERSLRSDNGFVAGSRSSCSHDRTKSQANTASRMMPPPESNSAQVIEHNTLPDLRQWETDKLGQQFSSTRGRSSPDYMHSPSATAKHTYGDHDSQRVSHIDVSHSPQRNLDESSARKRKHSISRSEQGKAGKKQRTSSQAYPLNPSSGLRNGSPRSQVVRARSKTQHGSSHPQESTSSSSRSSTRANPSSAPLESSSRALRPSGKYQPRRQQSSSSQAPIAGPTRRSSSRLTKSKGASIPSSMYLASW
ncbi:Nn.00g085610.m01.CDS01 [Neocucurbitaria sp. VM-36]